MKSFLYAVAAATVLSAVSTASGQTPSRFLKARFEGFDTDGDGFISIAEAKRPGMVLLNDADKDGKLSRDEFANLMERIVGGRAAESTPWSAAEFHNDIPADASISKASVFVRGKVQRRKSRHLAAGDVRRQTNLRRLSQRRRGRPGS